MRLFVGIELDAALREAAAAAAEALRKRLKARGLDARWIPAENLHITIWFIGEVPDEKAKAIEGALSAPFPIPPFDLAVAGCGAFPRSGPARVIWFGLTRGVDSLTRLYADVGARLGALGVEPERRPYSPHLTVARVKDVPRGAARAIHDILNVEAVDCGACRVRAVTLFLSRTSPTGATYEPLLRVPLS